MTSLRDPGSEPAWCGGAKIHNPKSQINNVRAVNIGRQSGFTLIELIAVVLIVGMMVALTATRIDFLVPKYRLRGAAREVGALAKQGKARAVATGKDVYFEADLSQGRYWLLVAFPKELEEGRSEKDVPVDARGVEYQPVFERSLPEGVLFTDIIFSEKDKIDSGRARIRLSPFGVSAHTIINLRNRDDREFAIKMNGFTGTTSFYEERKEADELLEDTGP